jgi:hypothetical protein
MSVSFTEPPLRNPAMIARDREDRLRTMSVHLRRQRCSRREGFSPRYLKVAGSRRDHERWAVVADDRR